MILWDKICRREIISGGERMRNELGLSSNEVCGAEYFIRWYSISWWWHSSPIAETEQYYCLSQYLTNLMHKICFTISFISCLYMFRARLLIIRRSKLHYTASGIIAPAGGRPVHRLREDSRLKTRLQTQESSLNLCTGRPPTGVIIPDAV